MKTVFRRLPAVALLALSLGALTTAHAGVITVSNATPIVIPGSGTSGTATPFPSTITVGAADIITKLTVSLFGLSHTFPDDIDILLVGPFGQTLLLMSDVGTSSDIVNVDLAFDDAAAAGLPDASLITSGTYRPTNFGVLDTFPAPAPSGPYGTSLSVFNGLSSAGTWSLYVVDDANLDIGQIAGGWSMTITTQDVAAGVPTPGSLALAALGLGLLAASRRKA